MQLKKRIISEVFEDGLWYKTKSTAQQVKILIFPISMCFCLSQCLWVNSQVLSMDEELENLDFCARSTVCVAFYLHTW